MNNEAIKKIADTYGYDAQSRQLIEEMAELTQAINKYWRKQLLCGQNEIYAVAIGNPEEKAIIEEIADVEICISQLKYLLCIKDTDIEQIIEHKLNRQLERIEKNELIDRQALIKQLKDENIPFNAEINEIINIQPIAFDVANIVEKLEHSKEMPLTDCGKSYNRALDLAINIVKQELNNGLE